MPSSSVIKNNCDGTITVTNGVLTTTARFDSGDFAFQGLKRKFRETAAYQTRGILHSVRHTARMFPTLSFSAMMANLTSASNNDVMDAVLRRGAWAAAASTLGANADVYTLNVSWTIEGTALGDSSDHVGTFNDVELSVDGSEGDPNSISFSGTVYGSTAGDLAITP